MWCKRRGKACSIFHPLLCDRICGHPTTFSNNDGEAPQDADKVSYSNEGELDRNGWTRL